MEAKISDYFNKTLKRTLNYPESFDVRFDRENRIFSLYSDRPSQLIRNKSLLKKIEDNLYQTFNNIDPAIIDVRINIINDRHIEINYAVKGMLSNLDTGPYANILNNLDISQMSDLCSTNPKFHQLCKNADLIVQVISNKYGLNAKEYTRLFMLRENHNLIKILKKIQLYDFIINTMIINKFDKYINSLNEIYRQHGDEMYFFNDNYEEFKKFQSTHVNTLSSEDLDYYIQLIELLNDNVLSIMDKEDMSPQNAKGLYFQSENGKVIQVIN